MYKIVKCLFLIIGKIIGEIQFPFVFDDLVDFLVNKGNVCFCRMVTPGGMIWTRVAET